MRPTALTFRTDDERKWDHYMDCVRVHVDFLMF
jgi:hypothetical protein